MGFLLTKWLFGTMFHIVPKGHFVSKNPIYYYHYLPSCQIFNILLVGYMEFCYQIALRDYVYIVPKGYLVSKNPYITIITFYHAIISISLFASFSEIQHLTSSKPLSFSSKSVSRINYVVNSIVLLVYKLLLDIIVGIYSVSKRLRILKGKFVMNRR